VEFRPRPTAVVVGLTFSSTLDHPGFAAGEFFYHNLQNRQFYPTLATLRLGAELLRLRAFCAPHRVRQDVPKCFSVVAIESATFFSDCLSGVIRRL